MLILSSEIAKSIRHYGARDYPNETCGAMLGIDNGEGREIRALFPLTNRRDDSPRNRFSITAEDFRDAERAAKLADLGADRVVLAMPPELDIARAEDVLSACAQRLGPAL